MSAIKLSDIDINFRLTTAKIRHHLQSLPLCTANSPPEPDETAPLLNVDVHGNPLTYKTAKAGPDKAHWEKAEGDEITRLITSSTIFPIPKHAPRPR